MKIVNITQVNKKGQIVIPQELRKTLGINPDSYLNLLLRGQGIYLYPIKEIITNEERENSYMTVLQKTQGAWVGDDWLKTQTRRRKIEIRAAKTRKRAW